MQPHYFPSHCAPICFRTSKTLAASPHKFSSLQSASPFMCHKPDFKKKEKGDHESHLLLLRAHREMATQIFPL